MDLQHFPKEVLHGSLLQPLRRRGIPVLHDPEHMHTSGARLRGQGLYGSHRQPHGLFDHDVLACGNSACCKINMGAVGRANGHDINLISTTVQGFGESHKGLCLGGE